MTSLALAMLLASTLHVHCVAQDIACNAVVLGERDVDGCPTSVYPFHGTANQLVTATVRPLSPTLTNTTITLVSPQGHQLTTPMSVGGAGGTVAYRLPASGVWNIMVGSSDPVATGAFALGLSCGPQSAADDCIDQQILCGQTHSGSLTTAGCRFSNVRERHYQLHFIYGVAGDVVDIELDSDDFPPQINLYSGTGGSPIIRAPESEPGKARMTFTFPQTATYAIGVTSSVNDNIGDYVLRVNCARSGCLDPLILAQPDRVEVPYGDSATLDVAVHHTGPVVYSWFEFEDFPRLVGTTTIPQWETGAITGTRFYLLRAESPCGSDESNLITVAPIIRRRSVRH